MRIIFWRNERFWAPFVFVLLLGLAPINAGAEQTLVLGLDDLIRMALETSPKLKEAEQDIIAAESDLGQAKGAQWAQLDVVGTAGPVKDAETPVVRVNPIPVSPGNFLVGKLKDRDEDGIGIFGRLEIAAIQPIFTFGKISRRKDAAAHGVAVQKAGREKTSGEVILGVKQLYYGFIVAQQGKGSAEDAGAFVRDAKARIQNLLKVRSTTVDETDLYRMETLESQITQFKAKADSGARVAYLALKKAIGLPAHQEFRLDRDELPKDGKTVMEVEDDYVRMAMERRPDLEQLSEGVAAKKSLYDAARADLYPTIYIGAFGSFAGAPGRDRLDISYFSDDFNHVYGGVFLGGHWHFDFGIGLNKVKKAKSEYERLLHTKEFAEQNIPVQVTKYYQDVIESKESYEAYEKGVVSARKWVVAAFANFDFGVGSARDMFDAIDRYGKNQGEYLLSLYNYNMALANLSDAVAEYRVAGK